ncbi:TRAP transporter small permease [Frigidibacter sp. MR17.24]|uniref:TRAP transporter small permease n=1 Tax=Frigidibacter sp. MR17.24 TaxID=3127345 RepID=UPI003012D7B9
MKRLDSLFYGIIDLLLVLLLAAMTIMVFGNVVLRYGFGSGIDISEEMSRFCFVWLIFLGSISAMRRHQHMGFDLVITVVGPRTRRVLLTIAHALIVFCCGLLLTGTLQQWQINATNRAPVTGLPMSVVFGVAVPAAIAIGAMAAWRMIGYATGRETEAHTAEEIHQ